VHGWRAIVVDNSLYLSPTAKRKLNLDSRALKRLRASEQRRPTTPLLRELQSSLLPSIDASFDQFCSVSPPLSLSLSLSLYLSLKSISKAQFCSKWSFYELSINSYRQWCRSVVKMSGVRFSQASRQTDSDYTLRQWFPNTQQSRFLAACMAPRKISFTSHFWHKSFILDDVKLAKLSNNSFWMKECDILRDHKFITLWPLPTYFQGDKTPSPWDLRPCLPS